MTVGTVSERLSAFEGLTRETMLDANTRQTSLGAAVADSLCRATGAELAIVNGGDLYFNLPAGEVTWEDVRAVFAEDRQLAVAEVSPKQLAVILESALSHIALAEDESIIRQGAHGAFPQVSGFTLVYDVSAPPGKRLQSIALTSGHQLSLSDDETRLTLAATVFMFEGGYDMPPVAYTRVDTTLAIAFADAIAAGLQPGYDSAGERVRSIGSRDTRPFAQLSRGSILICTALLIGIILAARGRLSEIGLFKKPGER
ncbi:MAG: 5'-nucleotidase C-terminal domain-containing protein [Oscillospiraceae bacterium]|nr:5'-nucleotidase C-terminal domain-containing protein [Oscillospiraceae bacterium]